MREKTKGEKIVEMHDNWRRECLNLQASENYLSPRVRRALASDMASRYSMIFDEEVHGVRIHNAYGGTKYQEEILNLADTLASEIFGFKFATVRPLSGHVAAMAALLTVTQKGDKIMAIPPQQGGYDGYAHGYLPDIFSFKYIPLKVDNHGNVDTSQIRKEKPQVIVLGASYILFPYNLEEVLEVSRDMGARVIYDASHVMGLLPAGFQKNIEKCDLIYGSTHKTFPGPQGGIIMSNDEDLFKRAMENLTWRVQDNYHSNRVAAMALALEEFKPVAKKYGTLVAQNSQSLGNALSDKGLSMLYPPQYSRSHQLLVDVPALKKYFDLSPPEMSQRLEKNNIIVDCVGRIGTAEITWKGYKPGDMDMIAEAMVLALRGGDVRSNVAEILALWDGKTMGERELHTGSA